MEVSPGGWIRQIFIILFLLSTRNFSLLELINDVNTREYLFFEIENFSIFESWPFIGNDSDLRIANFWKSLSSLVNGIQVERSSVAVIKQFSDSLCINGWSFDFLRITEIEGSKSSEVWNYYSFVRKLVWWIKSEFIVEWSALDNIFGA